MTAKMIVKCTNCAVGKETVIYGDKTSGEYTVKFYRREKEQKFKSREEAVKAATDWIEKEVKE